MYDAFRRRCGCIAQETELLIPFQKNATGGLGNYIPRYSAAVGTLAGLIDSIDSLKLAKAVK